MPSKKKETPATSKMTAKNLQEQETPFDPVPYETTDVRTSITLLSSLEKEVVIRALNVLAKYADKSEFNVSFLYKNGIIHQLLELIAYSDFTILRFSLKLLSQIVTLVPEAARELSVEPHDMDVIKMNYIFMTIEDLHIKEFSAQCLSHVVKSERMATSLLKIGVIVTVFNILKTSTDPDTQLHTLMLLNNVLEAREAVHVLPHTPEFSPRTILCYLKIKIPEIRETALNVIEKLASWRSGPMQELLREEHIVETLFKLILNIDYKALHKKAFDVILTCTECLETASYFVKSLEFVQFCEWAKTCPKKCLLPTITILTALTRQNELRQVLFDFSVEDAVLSFFRTENELVFYKTCEAVYNMSSHRYCCKKIVTPVVIERIARILHRKNISIIPYHEIALKTLCALMKRDGRTINFLVACEGVYPIMDYLLVDKNEFTNAGASTLLEILYLFASNTQHQTTIMNSLIFEMLVNTLEATNEYSQIALLIIDQYINVPEYRQYFLEFKGPEVILKKITSTPNEKELKNILVFLQRVFMYKKIGMAFLWNGCVPTLEKLSDKVKEAIPIINRLINTMYDLYLPLKFHKLGRLDITDHLTSRFHLMSGPCPEGFPFLELLDVQFICPINTVYIVDFSANVDELIKKKVLMSTTSTDKTSMTTLPTVQFPKRVSNLKSGSGSRSQRVSLQLNKTPISFPEEQTESALNFISCRVPPPINFGAISQDPYLPQYLEKLKQLLHHDKKYILCFQHQVKLVAKFVRDILSGPEEASTELMNRHCLDVHLAALREKLGTNLTPIGYLRYGFYCERALLFKALAERVGIPTTLVRGQIEGKNNMRYWNEVPIATEEPYININDEQRTYLTYAVVDLIDDVGNLMLVGSSEANKYCGLLEYT